MTPRIQPTARTRIADAADAILAAAAIALIIIAATGVLTGSTALGLVPEPVGEPGSIPRPGTNTTIRIYAADAYRDIVPVGHHQQPPVLVERAADESNRIPGRR